MTEERGRWHSLVKWENIQARLGNSTSELANLGQQLCSGSLWNA